MPFRGRQVSTYFSSSIGVDVALNQCDLRTVSYKEASTLPFLRSSSKIQSEIHAEDGQFSESSSYGGRTTKVLGKRTHPISLIVIDVGVGDGHMRRISNPHPATLPNTNRAQNQSVQGSCFLRGAKEESSRKATLTPC